MALIKNAIADLLARDAVVLDLGDLQRQGSLLIQSAKVQAERIVADARAERERVLAGANEKGHGEGFEIGVEEGRKKGREDALNSAMIEHKAALEKIEGAWSASLAEFSAQRDVLIQRATDDVLRLAVSIAERVVKRTIKIDPAVVVDQMRAVLGVVVRPTELVVAVHPEDRPLVQQALPGLLAFFNAVKHVELIDDGKLARGSCVARTRGDADSAASGDHGGGGIDASIQTQLDRMIEAVLPRDTTDVPEGEQSF